MFVKKCKVVPGTGGKAAYPSRRAAKARKAAAVVGANT